MSGQLSHSYRDLPESENEIKLVRFYLGSDDEMGSVRGNAEL